MATNMSWLSPEMKKAGFETVPDTKEFSLAVLSTGPEKRGKTHWAFTAPKPLVALASDTGTERVAAVFKREDPRIALHRFRVTPGQQKKEYEQEWLKMEKALESVLMSSSVRSIVVDTGTEFWEMLRLARFGKLTQVMPHHYGPVNNEMKELVKAVVDKPGLNSVWIHKLRKQYATNKQGVDAWTGKMERAGFSDMPYLCECVIEHIFDVESRQFGVKVLDSGYNTAEVVGEEYYGDLCNFPWLASQCFPTTDIEYWMED